MRSTLAPHAIRDSIAASIAVSIAMLSIIGCGSFPGSEPSIDELNRVVSIPDPNVDDTPQGAPFLAGQRRDVGDADAEWMSDVPSGYSVGVLMPGDLDADGFDDLVVYGWEGARPDIVPCDDGCPGFHRLLVDVFYGGPGFARDGSLTRAAQLQSIYVNDLRVRVAAAGDVDGDGARDLLISVGTLGCEQGDAYLVHGGARLSGSLDVRDLGAQIRELGDCVQLGHAGEVGDLDGDGHGDYVVAAPGEDRAYLYYGDGARPTARRSEEDAAAAFHSADVARFGLPVAVGDVDGDGRADFVLRDVTEGGGRLGEEQPEMHVHYLLRGAAARFAGELDVASTGTRIEAASLSSVGDLDGDGRADLAATVGEGEQDAFLLAGRAEWPASIDVRSAGAFVERGMPIPLYAITGVIRAGDVDGDGHADMVYGDESTPPGGPTAGAAYLFRGPIDLAGGALLLDEATTFLGQLWESELEAGLPRGRDGIGQSMAGGGDLDGDGLDDLVFAAPGAPDHGRIYVWLGREGT